jgi:predicted component of type VI protein secretion system
MEVRLVVRTGPLKNKEIVLPAGETVVGRRKGCQIRVADARVSRQHCKFVFDGRQAVVEDLESANGTLVNGQRVQRAVLKRGDVVQIGGLEFGVAGGAEVADAEVVVLPRPGGEPARSEQESIAGVMAAMAEAETAPTDAGVLPIELDFGAEAKGAVDRPTEVRRAAPKKNQKDSDELVLEEADQAQADSGLLDIRWEPPEEEEKPKK